MLCNSKDEDLIFLSSHKVSGERNICISKVFFFIIFLFFLKEDIWVPTRIKQKAQRFLMLTWCAPASLRASPDWRADSQSCVFCGFKQIYNAICPLLEWYMVKFHWCKSTLCGAYPSIIASSWQLLTFFCCLWPWTQRHSLIFASWVLELKSCAITTVAN